MKTKFDYYNLLVFSQIHIFLSQSLYPQWIPAITPPESVGVHSFKD